MAISRQKEARSVEVVLLLANEFTDLYIDSTAFSYYRQHCTLHAFEKLEALYIHSLGEKHPTDRDSNPVPLSFEPQTDRMSHRGRATPLYSPQ